MFVPPTLNSFAKPFLCLCSLLVTIIINYYHDANNQPSSNISYAPKHLEDRHHQQGVTHAKTTAATTTSREMKDSQGRFGPTFRFKITAVLVLVLLAGLVYLGYDIKTASLLGAMSPSAMKTTTTSSSRGSKSGSGNRSDNASNRDPTSKITRRKLPSLENGGIVIFIHIPKTGGTSIRELIKYGKRGRRSKVHYIYLTGHQEFYDTLRLMYDWTVNGTGTITMPVPHNSNNNNNNNSRSEIKQERISVGKVVFIEYHAIERQCPTFLQFSQKVLPYWKQLASQHGVPLFTFSLVRDPVSMAISFFNYYHGIPQNPKRFDWLLQPNNNKTQLQQKQQKQQQTIISEQVFLDHVIANPQCLFLAHNEDAFTKTGHDLRQSFTYEECRQASTQLVMQMDWIGTTDTLGNETLPLLKQLFSTNPYAAQQLIHNLNIMANPTSQALVVDDTNDGHDKETTTTIPPPIQRSKLSQTAIDYIHQRARWDEELLYDTVRRKFSFMDLYGGQT